MKVSVTVTECVLTTADGYPVAGLEVACARCGEAVEVFGTSDRSVRRACATLRDGCPRQERNFYRPACPGDDEETY